MKCLYETNSAELALLLLVWDTLLLLKQAGMKGLMGFMFSDTAMIQIIASMRCAQGKFLSRQVISISHLFIASSRNIRATKERKILGI